MSVMGGPVTFDQAELIVTAFVRLKNSSQMRLKWSLCKTVELNIQFSWKYEF